MAEATAIAKRQRLKDDFEFYARNCLFIRTKAGEVLPFTLNDAQAYIHQRLEEQRAKIGKVRAIILKGRQQGCSTLVEGRFYWRTTHRKGIRTFILTHEAEATSNLFAMVSRYHQNCPEFVRPAVSGDNSRELIFEELDSDYKVGTAGNKAVGRGSTIQNFHGSEVAFWPNADEHVKGVMQAVPDADDTEIILESTANGMGNFYHQQWKKAEAGESEYIAIFVPWYWQSEYSKEPPKDFELSEEEETLKEQYELTDGQIYWRRVKIAELSSNGTNGERAFKQEYPFNAAEAFQISGRDGLILPDAVMRARKNKVNGAGPLIVGVDPSRGGDRFSVIRRQGRKMYGVKSYVEDEVDTLGKSVAICKALLDTICPIAGRKPDMMFVDAGGGAELVERLHELVYCNRVGSIAFGATPLDPLEWLNKRAEMWDRMRQWLDTADIPDDRDLRDDLIGIEYGYDIKMRMQLEKKEDMKKRGLSSPDAADALSLSFYAALPPIIHYQEYDLYPEDAFL